MKRRGWGTLLATTGLLLGIAALAAGAETPATELVETAIAETERTRTLTTLAQRPLLVAGSGVLVGAGAGTALSGGAVYWRKRREFRRRLE